MLRGYRSQNYSLNRQRTATSLIKCTLILIATLQQWQHALVLAIATTSAAAITRQTTGFGNPAKYDDEATQNYYRIRAGDSNEKMATAAAAATYANYLAATANYNRPEGKEEVSATLITRDNLAALHAAASKNREFMPTTLTAAGQHYAAATPTANNDYELLLGGESFKLPTGDKIDYDEINSDSFERARDSSSSTDDDEAYKALALQQQQHQQQHYFGPNDDELRDDFAFQPENDGHYLHDYHREQFSNYQQHDVANYAPNANNQQQQQELRLTAATPTTTHGSLSYGNQQQLYVPTEQLQQQQHNRQQQVTASSQLQVQVTDSNGRPLQPTNINSGKVADNIDNDSARSSSLYHYQTHEPPKPLNNDLEPSSNHQLDSDMQHMQHQLQEQKQRFAQLQLQLQQHDIQLQHQHHHPPLPPPTTTVHHTAASAAAVAGIPLARHVHVTKQVPTLSHYQQQLVPFKQKVSIEIPRPVITTVPRPYAIQIPMTKTVAVPQMKEIKIPIEKIKPFPVERNVPYIVERRVPYRVEKQVAKPYYFPYPIKVPVVKTIVHRAPTTSTKVQLHPHPHSHLYHQQLHFQSHSKPHVRHNLSGLF